jgi:Arc/MetJ-type ribon-helix-helix transcriptional regulator
MELNLSPQTLSRLDTQIQSGAFGSDEEAIEYSIGLARLRATLYASIADPRRFDAKTVRANLQQDFAERRAARQP